MSLTISKKLPIVIVTLATISIIITGVIAFLQTEKSLEEAAVGKLEAIQESRSSQILDYMRQVQEELITFSHDHMVIDAIKGLEDAFAEFGPNKLKIAQNLYITQNANAVGKKYNLNFAPDGSTYSEMHKKYHPFFRQLMKSRGYHDIFLVNEFGDVVYSVYKELDYATNLETGQWKDTGLAKVFKDVKKNQKPGYLAYMDFSAYGPAHGAPESFMAVPVFEYGGEFHGAIVFQLPIDRINEIMHNVVGMGATGDAYLVGADFLMRSDSRFQKEGDPTSILNQKVETESVKKALNGEKHAMVSENYRGTHVISAYGPIDLHGATWAVVAEVDMEEVDIPAIELRNEMIVIVLVTILAVSAIGYFFALSITNPIGAMTAVMGRLANKDWTTEVPNQERSDEIGDMASAVQVFKVNGQDVERLEAEQKANEERSIAEKHQQMIDMANAFDSSVGGVVQSVSAASTEMQSSAATLSATAEETAKQSEVVATAANDATQNVQTVASATEELSSSIQEISRQVSQSTQIAASAVVEVQTTNEKIQGLAEAANKIGEVVAMITDIADQTNLLALNATIEAARAGDAGKGFAVVASEVKNLANQTAKATEEISAQISGIQGATQTAVDAIGSIGGTIDQLNEISSAIAAAVEEQGAATQEIARNVEQAANGTTEVSSNIGGVQQAAGETGHSANDMLGAATELSQQSELLRSEVDKFLDNIRNG